ncbi:MauE/DoxX family redox-associated membrane protein [Arthrobacter sp. NA-172]|uniref:MauE/DoxX family redox-associated membrane protein n=1 Tax=Arthrobacter sp. NA-172 TaxID=3367524 RepID=UPI003754265A
MDIFLDIARLIGGGFFIWSGTSKFGRIADFWTQVMGYRLTSAIQARLIASYLPPTEFVLGMLFATGYLTLATGVILLLLLIVFSIAIGTVLIRRIETDCGCAGSGGQKIRPILLTRNLGIAAIVILGMFTSGPLGISNVVIAISGALLIGLLGTVNYRTLGK